VNPDLSSYTAETLRGADARTLFPNSHAPEAALAGLWISLNEHQPAHELAQGIESAEGSLWHAILHREEPDPVNAAYWFRHVGKTHPCYPGIAAAAREILKRYPEAGFQVGQNWDPYAFIDFCESARAGNNPQAQQAADEIRKAEWGVVFEYCVRPKP
jgi:hypothetical protein